MATARHSFPMMRIVALILLLIALPFLGCGLLSGCAVYRGVEAAALLRDIGASQSAPGRPLEDVVRVCATTLLSPTRIGATAVNPWAKVSA